MASIEQRINNLIKSTNNLIKENEWLIEKLNQRIKLYSTKEYSILHVERLQRYKQELLDEIEEYKRELEEYNSMKAEV